MTKWGAGLATAGWACIGYDWGYVPICTKVFHVEPWGLTTYGLVTLGIALCLNGLQLALDMP